MGTEPGGNEGGYIWGVRVKERSRGRSLESFILPVFPPHPCPPTESLRSLLLASPTALRALSTSR